MSTKAEDSTPYTTGSCACGSVKYTITAAPIVQYVCYCRSCQRSSGSALAANCWVEPNHFHLDEGEDLLKQFHDLDIDSTTSTEPKSRNFCSLCGGTVFIMRGERPESIIIIGATMDNFGVSFKPSMQAFARSKVAWLKDVETATCYEAMPDAETLKAALAT